ncbi:MAG TPA: hypothetical protein VEX18_21900 [Polyangiaceae bacterium]|nr:hypothetical protein [Polyangiaceae bacterium]
MRLKEEAQLRRMTRALSLCVATAALGACGNGGSPNGGGAGSATSGSGGAAGAAVAGSDAGGLSGAGGTAGSPAAGSGGAAGSAGSGGDGSAGCSASMTDDEQPMLLSETKCVDMADPTKPAPGLVPYSVQSALWSDGAEKERFLRIPDGAKIHPVDCATEPDLCADPGSGGEGLDDGHWDLPIGTVLVKNFSLEGKHIETRLLMRRNSRTWKGFSYEWNDDGTEANLLPEGKNKPVGTGTQVWQYPSRAACLECHTQYAGRSLGPNTRQLNADHAYAEGTMNQVAKFTELGLFDVPPKDLPGYPDPYGTGTLEERARSYLQTNCAICHRPGGEFSTVDMRFGTALAETNLCGASEHDESLAAYRLVPGQPTLSSMSVRMQALDTAEAEVRMPKLGSTVIDEQGVALIDEWITSLPSDACPPQPQ